MRLRKRALSVGVGALAASLLLGACGSGGSTGSTTSDGVTTVEWALWASGSDEQAQWQHVADMVHEKYPKIKVKLRTSPFGDYFTKLKTQMAGGQSPCIVTMQSLRLPKFAKTLAPLDDLMAENDFAKSEWSKPALEALQWEGEQLGLPYGFSTLLMYYNADAFAKAGVPEPKPGWTIEDFEKAAAELTQKGRPGFGMSFSDLHMFSMLGSYNGARPVDESGKLQMTTPKMKQAFSWYSGLATKQQVGSVPASSSEIPWGEQQFANGNVAMAVDGTWNLGSNTSTAKFDLGVAPLPEGDDPISYIADSGFSVAESCEAKEEAYKAISVLTGPKAQKYLASQGRAYPARPAQVKAFESYLSSEEFAGKNPELAQQVKAAVKSEFSDAVPFLGTNNWDATTKLIARHFLPAYTGASTPEKALQTVQQQAGR